MDVTVFTSAARGSGANNSSLMQMPADKAYRGVWLVLDVTAVSGTTPTLDVKLQRYDNVSNNYVDIPGAAFAQKSAANTSELVVYPGIAETANVSVSDVLTNKWRAVGTVGGSATPTVTFTLAGSYIA